MPLIVSFNVLLVGLIEFVLAVLQVLLAVGLALCLGLLTGRLFFPVFLLDRLSWDDVLLSRGYGHFEPLEELSKAGMVVVDLLLVVLLDDLLHIVDSHVRPILVFLLSPEGVGGHLGGQLLLNELLSLLPAQFV